MERAKHSLNRNQKKLSSSHLSNEFFALGNRDEAKQKVISKSQNLPIDRKRDSTSQIIHSSKKPKLNVIRLLSDGIVNTSSDVWENIAPCHEVLDLINTIYSAFDLNDNETVERLLCGYIKNIMSSQTRLKTDLLLFFIPFYIAKLHPALLLQDILITGLLKLLRRDINLKTRLNLNVYILVTNLLTKGYENKEIWPEQFLRSYIEDAINDRFWIDNECCIPFVQIICSVFKTSTPPPNLDIGATGSVMREDNIETSNQADINIFPKNLNEFIVETVNSHRNREFDLETTVDKYVADIIKEQFNKRQQQDNHNKNLLKFLSTTAGLSEIRSISISRLELWLHNGKLVKFAQQLLSYICFNIRTNCVKDFDVLTILVKMRLKTKPLINFYMLCLKEMIVLQPNILCVILKLVVQNELSNTRNPNNMGMLATMFHTCPDDSAVYLAEIYKEFLLQRDDCLRTLRVFLRELVRVLRFEIKTVKFTKVLLEGRPDLMTQIEQSEFNERIFYSIVDITCLSILLTVSPLVREATMTLRTSRDMKNNPILIHFYNSLSQIQLDAVSWMYDTVPRRFKLQSTDYGQALHKLLLLENPEQYSRCDQWPSEPERATLLRIVSETPVHEDVLLRIILIGITKEIPFTIPDTLDIIILVIKRASTMRVVDYPAVQTKKFDIIDFLFSMAEYHHPDNIKLPSNYEPPKLAIIVLYWKAWLIMLMISAHNPSTFGAFCWDHYPTMKLLMEMCITNQLNENIIIKEELQILQIERDNILEFESYLAAQTSQAVITEDNAILLAQLMLMDPMGQARRIPAIVLDQLRYLNKALKIGHLLCRCRKPDLLLDIIQRQGTTQSMPWLSDLVQNSEGDFNHLPVQCLCEFLMFNGNIKNENNNRDADLINFLRDLVIEPDSSKHSVCEVLDYIFRRLASTVKQSRAAAIRGLKIIFKCSDMYENDWLLRFIPQIPHFEDVRRFIIPQLRSACQVENCPMLVMSYIQFIAAHTLSDSVTDMLDHVMDMAQLIVERSTMFQHIIPTSNENDTYTEQYEMLQESKLETLKCLFVMFNNYIIKLRGHSDPYEWPEYPDLLMVQFNDGMQLPLHLNVIHALVILLTLSSTIVSESIPILDYWFPIGSSYPNAYLPNLVHEPVQLLPDWLKLRMIRSSVDHLLEAAIHDLTPDQIVLFVQNFGTPINSMSKLLALLDHAVIEQFNAVKEAILNKAYLAQLIEIQQLRGAKNGHFTLQALNLQCELRASIDNKKRRWPILEHIELENFQSTFQNETFIGDTNRNEDEIINMIFRGSAINNVEDYQFRQFIHKILEHINKDEKNLKFKNTTYIYNKSIKTVQDHLKNQNSTYILVQKHHICSLVRVLLKCSWASSNHFLIFVDILYETRSHLFNWEELPCNLKTYSQFLLSLLNIVEKIKIDDIRQEKKSYLKFYFQKNILTEMVHNIYKNILNDKDSDIYSKGLLVDWLAEVDPEFTIVCNFLQSHFLFSKNCWNFRYYLLSLLCHQTNWETLLLTLKNLLRHSFANTDTTAVLNFIEALINNPRLWQGRDKNVLRMSKKDIFLPLEDQELEVFSNFIMQEAECDIVHEIGNCEYKVCSRVSLLLKLTHKNNAFIVEFIEKVSKSSCSQFVKSKILQQLYVMHPLLKSKILNETEENTTKLQTLKGCVADKISNYLITCFGNLFVKKDFESLFSDTEILLRKLAASHPTLLLRQLNLLSSLIEEKAYVNLRSVRDDVLINRFLQILCILKLLQPMIFDDAYKAELQSVLRCYFCFLDFHCDTKDAFYILLKFIEFLQTYVNINPASAFEFSEKFLSILNRFSLKFNSIPSLHQLVQGIAFLQNRGKLPIESHSIENKKIIDLEVCNRLRAVVETETLNFNKHQVELSAASLAISASYNKSEALSSHVINLIKIIRHTNTAETLFGPLQEIENFSVKCTNVLDDLFDKLLELIFSSNVHIRTCAFLLLIRHLKQNPGHSHINKYTLNAYIQCLRNDNASVASTAVDNLSEITILLQEHVIEILSVAFSLAIKSRLNINAQIKRVLQTYLLQHGY